MSTAPLLAVLRAHPAGLSQHELSLATGLEMEAVYVALGALLKRREARAVARGNRLGSVYLVRGKD